MIDLDLVRAGIEPYFKAFLADPDGATLTLSWGAGGAIDGLLKVGAADQSNRWTLKLLFNDPLRTLVHFHDPGQPVLPIRVI